MPRKLVDGLRSSVVMAVFSAATSNASAATYYLNENSAGYDLSLHPWNTIAVRVDIDSYLGDPGAADDGVQFTVVGDIDSASPFTKRPNFGVQGFGWNLPANPGSADVVLPTGQTLETSMNQDGFGRFAYVMDTTGQHRRDPLVFRVVGSTDVAAYVGTNNRGYIFASHLADFSTGILAQGEGIAGAYFGTQDPGFAPVPEPSTYAMLLAGLGLLGAAARRARGVHAVQPTGRRREMRYLDGLA